MAYLAIFVIVIMVAGGAFVLHAVKKTADDNTMHAEWDYERVTDNSLEINYNPTFKIAIKNIEKSDTKDVSVLCSSIKLIGTDGKSYSVQSSKNTNYITVFTPDGWTGMGQGVVVKMNET